MTTPTPGSQAPPPDGTAGSETIAIVTGATSGIGRALAEALAAREVAVGLVAREAQRGEATRREIVTATGSDRVSVYLADLSSLSSVRGLAETVAGAHDRIGLLVHCAAVYTRRRTETIDGLEAMFATNHLAPFLLTSLLLGPLRAAEAGRVLILSAPSTVKLDFDDLQGERRFGSLGRFGASKTANLLFAFELARRLEGTSVTANAIHPGLARTGLMRQAAAPLRWGTWLISRSPDRVAADIVPLALSPAFDGRSGGFYHRGRQIDPPSYTTDAEVGRRLWEVSERLTGLGGDRPIAAGSRS